jgi:hypothetical protein
VVQQLGAGLAEQVAHAYRDPAGGQDRVDLALPAAADRDQLGAMAHQLPQLPHLRRGDPRLRQPTHAQQIRQIGRVAEVVVHPPVGEPFTPNGCARCTLAPIVANTSAAPYQP